jgi:hypothetical protein
MDFNQLILNCNTKILEMESTDSSQAQALTPNDAAQR